MPLSKNSPLLQSFISVIIGPPKSGKSHLAVKLATQDYKDCFKHTIYVTPSPLFDVELCDGYNYFKTLDIMAIANTLRHMDSDNKENYKQTEQKEHILIILDDCLA